MNWGALPTINACLNATSAMLLVMGWRFIRRRDIVRHKRCMISAAIVSTLFLVGYLTYHAHAGLTRYPVGAPLRTTYLVILATHTALAVTVPILAGITLTFALTNRFARHRRIARFTLPIWLYVSVTGVIVYLMLYHLAPR